MIFFIYAVEQLDGQLLYGKYVVPIILLEWDRYKVSSN